MSFVRTNRKVERRGGGIDLAIGVRSEHTLTRQGLAEAVYAVVSLPRKEAAQLVDQVLDEICNALVRDGEAKLRNFGALKVSSKAERVGREATPQPLAACDLGCRRRAAYDVRRDSAGAG